MTENIHINNALKLYTKRKISYFESILKEEKILRDRINILENYFRQNFNYEKSREYIRDIFTFELIAVSSISKTDIIEGDIRAAVKSINSVLDFFNANQDLLKDFLLLLAKYAISDLYYFLNTYWFHKHKSQFQFKINFPAAASELRTVIETHRPVFSFTEFFFSEQILAEKFFIRTKDRTGYTFDDVVFKDFYDKNLVSDSDSFFSCDRLSRTVERMAATHAEMENHFKLLFHYYDSKTGKPFRYNIILENFEEKLNSGVISENLLSEFTSYNDSFNNYREIIEHRGLLNFGFENYSYRDISVLLYKYAKILEFIYLRRGMYSKVNTLRDTTLANLEKRITAVNQTDPSF